MNLPDSVLEAANALKEQGPWSGTLEERHAKFQAFVINASRDLMDYPLSPIGLLQRAPEVTFEDVRFGAPAGSSALSDYDGTNHVITIRNKPSVTTLFWLFNQAAGSDRPVPLAHEMFEHFFPEQASRLIGMGNCRVASHGEDELNPEEL